VRRAMGTAVKECFVFTAKGNTRQHFNTPV
jgi:hypothetical protein